MATRSKSEDFAPILSAARTWIDTCLVEDGSIFTPNNLWTIEGIAELKRAFSDNPDETDTKFMQKLSGQMQGASPEGRKLMSEFLWASWLFPTTAKPATKRAQVQEVFGFSGDVLPSDHAMLSDAILSGIGSAGTAYNTGRWAELVYIISLAQSLKSETTDFRRSVFSDYDKFISWIESVPRAGSRQFRHMLRFFVFPERVERMASNRERRRVLESFRNLPERESKNMTDAQLDQALLELRGELEREHPGETLDFYRSPLVERWAKKPSQTATLSPEGPASPVSQVEEPTNRFGPPFDELFSDEEQANAILDQIARVILRVQGSLTERDRRIVISYRSDGPRGPRIRLILGNWAIFSANASGQYQIILPTEDPLWSTVGRKTDFTASPGEIRYSIGWVSPAMITTEVWQRSEAAIDHAIRRVAGWSGSPFESHHIPAVFQAAVDPENRLPILRSGVPHSITPPSAFVDDDSPIISFSRAEALQGIFMPEGQFDACLNQLLRKKNLVLQGPPGVGKTFVAQTLAQAVMGEIDATRVQMIQFHQSYGYEEFIQGLRPTKGGDFVVRDGVFISFCKRAAQDGRPHVFIIDEINRGNLSKILGELMMLLEPDKRDVKYAMPLAYDEANAPKFFVPPNLFVIGLMNTADRSLAMVDYALRRRFAFVTLKPEIASAKFRDHLKACLVPDNIADAIITGVSRLNDKIENDAGDLGTGYCIGHSYFCPPSDMASASEWLESVLEYEIKPLLSEYWMESSKRADDEIAEIKKLFA